MKYSKEKIQEICGYIEGGLGYVDACHCADISYETFTVWREKHPELPEALKKAEAKFKRVNLNIIRKAALRQWQPAAWLLERKFQDEFAQKYRLGHEGKDGAAIPLVLEMRSKLKGLPADQLKKLAKSL
jgi:hypothetical protein